MSPNVSDLAKALGYPDRESRTMSPISLISRIEDGLPVEALDKVSKSVAPADVNFKYRIVSRATLSRRRKPGAQRLLADEGDRLVRLARVWAFAKEVWGEEEAARAFLFRAHPLLEGKRPIDMLLTSELGAELVNDILGRLKHGSAA